MKKQDFTNQFHIDKKIAEDINFNPYYQLIQSGLANKIKVNDKNLINLGTNDYLGIANNSEIKKQAEKTLQEFGLSLCGTPIVIGQSEVNRKLELKIADFLKQDDALIYPSCYQCNIGLFKQLATKEDVIIFDKEIHSSLLNGIELANSNVRMFPHNNFSRLESILKNSQEYRMRFIVIEGLYSTNGDYPNLNEVINLAKKYEAFIIVDDAHGVGVLGDEGRGILEVYEAYDDIDLITLSLGKAIGTFGGCLAGKSNLIDYFRYSSPMYFYSTALPPAICGATIASLDFIQENNETRNRITGYANKVYDALEKMGFKLTKSTTPLISVVFKTPEETFLAAKILQENGVYSVPFIPPSVPKKTPRIRLTFNAYLKDDDIEKVIEAFAKLKKELC